MHRYRTHTCGELRKSHIGINAVLSGWIHNRRDHGGVLFIDLRDHYGITQVVIRPDTGFQYEIAHMHKETVVRFEGKVIPRDEDAINPGMDTGEVELEVSAYELLGSCVSLPFGIFPEEEAPEENKMGDKTQPYRKSKAGRFQISLFKFEKVIRNGDTIRSEVIIDNIRACVQYSKYNNYAGEWQRQQIWCTPEELRDIVDAIDKLTHREENKVIQ